MKKLNFKLQIYKISKKKMYKDKSEIEKLKILNSTNLKLFL